MSSSEVLTVFLMDQTQVQLPIDSETQDLTACQVLDKTLRYLSEKGCNEGRQLSFSDKCKKLFSIWLISPYLELQLQPKHRPFSVLAKWDSLLRKHGPTELITDPTLIDKDEPTLSLQRNVFCELIIESEISNEDIGALHLLYSEAKLNVLEGRYPSQEFEQLAAYQAAIESVTCGKPKFTVDYFRTHLKEYIPRNQIKTIDGGNRVTGLIRTLSRSSPTAVCAQNIFKSFNEIADVVNLKIDKLLKSYLDLCRKVPCYGSAFFSAQIEKPVKSKLETLMSHYDLPVWVAINQRGLHLVSKEKPELLLSIDINDLCWAIGCPSSSDPDCIPCIFVQIPDQSDETQQILQIFSRQYKLIESLLNSLIKDKRASLHICQSDELNANSNSSYDVTDGITSGPPMPHQSIIINKPNKLCLARLDQSGNYLNKTGTWLRKATQRNRV